jgi:hypothetical protein
MTREFDMVVVASEVTWRKREGEQLVRRVTIRRSWV